MTNTPLAPGTKVQVRSGGLYFGCTATVIDNDRLTTDWTTLVEFIAGYRMRFPTYELKEIKQ